MVEREARFTQPVGAPEWHARCERVTHVLCSCCKRPSLGIVSALGITSAERQSRKLNDFYIFQAVMVLKDIPYRDGKLFHV